MGGLVGLELPLPYPARNAPKVPRDRRAVPRPGDLRGYATCRGCNDLADIKCPPPALHRQSPALRPRDTVCRGAMSASGQTLPHHTNTTLRRKRRIHDRLPCLLIGGAPL